jgi:hypothetical protein
VENGGSQKEARMRSEHDPVRLKNAVSGVPAGTVGAVMMVLPEDPAKVLIEFPDPTGKEFLWITVHEKDLEEPQPS